MRDFGEGHGEMVFGYREGLGICRWSAVGHFV